MKNANDKYVEYARVIKMCKGTRFENKPWKCIKGLTFVNHPMFGGTLDLEFAVAILEDEPLFVGDKVYWMHDGTEFEWGMVNHRLFAWSNNLTRIPPKRTFVLNGEELPCPILTSSPHSLSLGIGFFYFNSENDRNIVTDAICKILAVAAHK